MTKNIFCLNFWKMLVPLTSMGNPGTGETVFKAEDRSANFEVLLGYANGDFFMQLGMGSVSLETVWEWKYGLGSHQIRGNKDIRIDTK